MSNVILRVKREDGSWAEIPALVGPEGPKGVSIDDIVLKSQEGGVSTYLILLSDGSEKTFQVTDGAIITDVSLINTNVLIDTYRISISDGSYFDFKVTNGRGIKSIAKTSTDVLSDTYTISYNDNTSSTFKVANGRGIKNITKTSTDVLTDTYTISYNDNTTSTYTITNGRGIDYIEKDQTIGISDRYTIHYNDGTTSYYHVVNGEAGPAGSIGNRVYLSGVVDKVNDETGYKRVKELKTSKFDKSKFTIVGNPLISEDGVASGFSNSDYLISNNIIDLATAKTWELYIKFTAFVQQTTNIMFVGYNINSNNKGMCFGIKGGKVVGYLGSNGSTWDIVNGLLGTTTLNLNTEYLFKAEFTGTQYKMSLSTDNGKTWNVENTLDSTTPIYNPNEEILIGLNYLNSGSAFKGSIDLSQFSISVDGKEVFSGNPTAIDTIKADNYTINGSPTISSDGIFKANASGDYLAKSGFSTEIKKELRCDGRFYYNTKDSGNNVGNILELANGSNPFWYVTNAGLIVLSDGTNTSTVQIEIPLKDGDIFDTEIIYNASTITLNVCLNEGVNYTTSIAIQGLTTFNTWRLSANENYWGGTIDLNTIHVYVDGNLVYQPCLKIPYTKAKTGSKIVDAAWKLRVEDCYNQYGDGNYYLFSSATEQFALPMPDIYGLIQTLDERWDSIQIADTDLSNLTEEGIKVIKDNSGSGLELCDIGMALYVDETKGLRRYLNGQIVDINANTQAFLDRLLQIKTTTPDYFTTEDNWQSEALLNIDGCVYKFVLNYADDGETVVSVRLPKYPDYVEINAGGTLPVYGNGITIGLTDGVNNYGMVYSAGNYSNYGVAYSGVYGSNAGTSAFSGTLVTGKSVGLTTDGDKSGIVANIDQTKLKLRYFIQIATGSETENNIINEIELNNPYSLFDSKYSDHELNNLSWLKSEGQWNAKAVYSTAYDKLLKVYNGTETVEGLSVKLNTENYTDYDFVLNTAEETFRLPIKVKLASGSAVVGNGMAFGMTDGSTNMAIAAGVAYSTAYPNWSDPNGYGKSVGTAYSSAYTGRKIIGVTTDPTKSGIETSDSDLYLYFYVGETVQNANLIDAGRIGEQLANKVDTSNTQWAANACMPDYTAGVSKSNNVDYIETTNGFLVIDYTSTNAQSQLSIIINGTSFTFAQGYSGTDYTHCNVGFIPIPKNTTYRFNGAGIRVRYFPCIGG